MPQFFQRMTEREWLQVLPLLRRLKVERRNAAYNHVVKGLSLARAGEPYGLRRQSVHDVVQRVLEKQQRLSESNLVKEAGVRKGWVRLTLDVPASAAKYVKRFAGALAQGVPVATALATHTPKRRKSGEP